MTLELIVFIATILFGVLWCWRESQGNRIYRFFNKLMYSKELQIKSTDKKGFVYQQSFLLRLVFITSLFLLATIVVRFLIPIDITTISIFASMIVGTVIGTYVADFIFKSKEVIDEKTDSLEEIVHNTLEKGKDFVENFQKEDPTELNADKKIEEHSKEQEKSARDRLKDKGLL